jgi:endonuclease-3
VAECALRHTSAYELLAATILSAQCTDERVNLVTPRLFTTYPDPQALAVARQADVEKIVRSTGFFRAKAGNLIGMAQGVVERFGGEIPQTLDELITLPGVGRKTANVLLGTWHGLPAGVVVDTHVKRITTLLGLTRAKTAEQIETDMMDLLPSTEWIQFSHRLIHHGRATCIARRPQCAKCLLRPECDRVGLPPLEESSSSSDLKSV